MDQRKRLVARIRELQPEANNSAIARTIGVDETTIRRDIASSAFAEPSEEKANETNGRDGSISANAELSGADAAKLVERKEAKLAAAEATKAKREASRNAEPLPDGMELRIGDCPKVYEDRQLGRAKASHWAVSQPRVPSKRKQAVYMAAPERFAES